LAVRVACITLATEAESTPRNAIPIPISAAWGPASLSRASWTNSSATPAIATADPISNCRPILCPRKMRARIALGTSSSA
jgi:hypothetical protein